MGRAAGGRSRLRGKAWGAESYLRRPRAHPQAGLAMHERAGHGAGAAGAPAGSPRAGRRGCRWSLPAAALWSAALWGTALTAGFPTAALAATVQVNTTADGTDTAGCAGSGACSLRAAILYANQNPGADTIQVPKGTYTLSLADVDGDEDQGLTGDLDVSGDLTLEGLGAGPGEVVITASGGFRVLEVLSGTVTVRNLTLRDGRMDSEGGGVLRNEADLTLDQVVVAEGRAPTGGGILNAGTLRLQSGSVVEGNLAFGSMAQGGGGGIRNEGRGLEPASLTVVGSIIRNNRAQALDAGGNPVSGQGGSGGGIYNTYGSVALDRSLVEGNVAAFNGGGIAHVRGGLVVARSVIRDNVSNQLGGGLDVTAPADVTQSAIVGNSAVQGGGGAAVEAPGQGSLGLLNSTVSGNQAGDGGGLRNSGTLTVTNSTVFGNDSTGNAATQIFTCGTLKQDPPNDTCAAGAYETDASGAIRQLVRTSLVNTVVGAPDGTMASCNPNPTLPGGSTLRLTDSLGHNIEASTNTCSLDQGTDTVQAPPSSLFASLSLPATGDHQQLLFPLLDPASLAKDQGHDGYCPSVDQRGVVRNDGQCDIGAYEIAAAGAPSANLVDLVTHIPVQEVKILSLPGGTQVAFDVTVANKGPSTAVGVTLKVSLPLTVELATTPVEASGNGTCAADKPGEPSFSCDLGDLPALAERRVRVTLVPLQAGDVLVTADAQPADKGTETFNPDNTASRSITVSSLGGTAAPGGGAGINFGGGGGGGSWGPGLLLCGLLPWALRAAARRHAHLR